MMKKILLATVAVAALGTASASAADLAARPYTKAPALAPLPTWAGFYIGAMGGYATVDGGGFDGGFAGGTIGYNWQQGPVVFGIEADAAWADLSANGGAPFPFVGTFNTKIQDMGTVRGRLGYAVGPTLLYATGGYAWADLKLTNTFGPFSSSDSQVLNGWTVGAGVEYMIAPKWSLKAEYLYKSFGGETFNTLTFPAASGTLNLHSVQVGVNYHF